MTKEEKDRVIYALEYVCNERRDSISRPFIRGDYIYATTGSVIARRLLMEKDKPLLSEYEARESAPSRESVERLFDKTQMNNALWFGKDSDIWTGLILCRDRHRETCYDDLRKLEHYTCPCCDNTVYPDGDTLVDEETAEQTLVTRYGIEVVAGGDKMTFAGQTVYDAVDCVSRLGKVMDIGVCGRNLLIIGMGFDCLICPIQDPLFPSEKRHLEIVGNYTTKEPSYRN